MCECGNLGVLTRKYERVGCGRSEPGLVFLWTCVRRWCWGVTCRRLVLRLKIMLVWLRGICLWETDRGLRIVLEFVMAGSGAKWSEWKLKEVCFVYLELFDIVKD